MKREEIINQYLVPQDKSVISFPERGPWGNNLYRGNCSGFIHAFLIWKYQVKKMAELFAGGGTGYDVSKDMEIDYVGADLNPVPVRPGILINNAVTDEVPEEFLDADFLYMHPPYSELIRIPYAQSMYPDPTGELSKYDLGQMPWDKFIMELNKIVMKYYASMQSGARMGILMGDVRRNGLHSMLNEIVKPGQLEQVIIKMQHNCQSNNRTYSNTNFVPLVHEYILVLKKVMPYMLDYTLPTKKELDIRDSKAATWRDVVYAVVQKLGRNCSLQEIYAELDGHRKTLSNPHWKEKVRQTLQQSNLFVNVNRGVWAIA